MPNGRCSSRVWGLTPVDAQGIACHSAAGGQQSDRQHHEDRLHLLRVHLGCQKPLARQAQAGFGCGTSQNLCVDSGNARHAQVLRQQADGVLLGALLRLVQVLRPCQQVASSDKAGKGTLYALRKGVHWYIGELQGQDPCACRNTTAGAVCKGVPACGSTPRHSIAERGLPPAHQQITRSVHPPGAH